MRPAFTWIDAEGQSTALVEANGYDVLLGAVGLDAPPVSIQLADRLTSDGSVLVGRRSPHRNILLPLFIEDPVRVGDLIGQAADFFHGPGVLRRDDGTTVRDLINVIYETGLEGNDDADVAGTDQWRKVVVSLIALDPWWYGTEQTIELEFGINIAFDAAISFDAAEPFDGLATIPVTVSGDVDALPETTLRGPFTSARVGISGGHVFSIAEPLASGDTITVDTRPGARGPRRNNGPIDWSLLTPESRLWTLPTGNPRMIAAVTGDDGNSLISVSYRERHRTP